MTSLTLFEVKLISLRWKAMKKERIPMDSHARLLVGTTRLTNERRHGVLNRKVAGRDLIEGRLSNLSSVKACNLGFFLFQLRELIN